MGSINDHEKEIYIHLGNIMREISEEYNITILNEYVYRYEMSREMKKTMELQWRCVSSNPIDLWDFMITLTNYTNGGVDISDKISHKDKIFESKTLTIPLHSNSKDYKDILTVDYFLNILNRYGWFKDRFREKRLRKIISKNNK